MAAASSDIIQRIAAVATDTVGSSEWRTLLYAEAGDGVISADLFSQAPTSASVQFRFASAELQNLVYCFWESGNTEVAPRSWATMQLLIEGGRLSIDFAYPNQIDQDEALHDRRPRAVAAHFPGLQVDYSLGSLR